MARNVWNKGLSKYVSKPCFCGCGELVPVHKYAKSGTGFTYSVNKFIKGHDKRGVNGFDYNIHALRLCLCGCGIFTNKFRGRHNSFIKGHENRGRVAWNKGKAFTEASRAKMSLARLGKEPANKVHLDTNELYEVYVARKMSAADAAKVLGISEDVVKNRIKSLRWSRGIVEACSLPKFREKMRKLRISVLSSQKSIESPNRLEKKVYEAIDRFGIVYEKQVPLFSKFVVDTLFPANKVVLEIFGQYWHEKPKIKKKDYSKKRYLEKSGYRVEEVWDYDIKRRGIDIMLREIFEKHKMFS